MHITVSNYLSSRAKEMKRIQFRQQAQDSFCFLASNSSVIQGCSVVEQEAIIYLAILTRYAMRQVRSACQNFPLGRLTSIFISLTTIFNYLFYIFF